MTIANAKPDLLITGPIGTTTVNAASSAWHDYLTVEAKITAAIAYAVSIGAKYCYVPDSFLPYTASLVTFNTAVRMLREGGNPGYCDVQAYGADPLTVLDSTTAISQARAAAALGLGLAHVVYFPEGTYRITGQAGVPSNYERILGAGERASAIRQDTDNIPVLKFGGYSSYCTDITLIYLNEQPTTNTAAVGLELYAPQFGRISNVSILHSCFGMQIKQAGTALAAAGGTSNYIATMKIDSIYIQASKVAIELIGFNAGNEGCVFGSVYCNMRNDVATPWACDYGVHIGACSDMQFNQISINSGGWLAGFYAEGSDTVTCTALHFEANAPRTNFTSCVLLNGTKNFTANGTIVAFNSILVANGVTSTGSIFRLTTGSSLIANGVSERNNTVTAATWTLLQTDANTAPPNLFWGRGVNLALATYTNQTTFTLGGPGNIRQLNTTTESFSADRGDNSITIQTGFDASYQWFNTPLTVARTVTLSTTGARAGDRFRVTRDAGATGAFNLTVGAKVLATASLWVEHTFDGTAWRESANGAL